MVSGALTAGGNTYVPPTSEGWACGPWENLDTRIDNATSWTSRRYLDVSGAGAGEVNVDEIFNQTATIFTAPAVGPWNFIQIQSVFPPGELMQTRKEQFFKSYKGGNLATADKIRMRGWVGPPTVVSGQVPINFTIYQGSWGTSIPDGTGDVVYVGQVISGSNTYVDFELSPHDDGGTRYYQYFIGIDNPDSVVSVTANIQLSDFDRGYSGPSRPDKFAPCYA